jgi:DNA-binding response OmpR family regulator
MVDDLLVDPLYHEVLRADRRVALTRLEFRLLHLLARHVNTVVPYPRLIEYGWGYPEVSDPTELLKSPISRLRTKVNLRPPGRLTIRSVARQGYMLCANF